MPNTYPIVASPTLPNFLLAVKQDNVNTSPLDTELANVLGAVDRQTRQFVYDFLKTLFSDSGKLLPGAVEAATLLNKITGSVNNTVGATPGGIQVGTVSTNDLRDLAVSTAKLALLSVANAQLADGSVNSRVLDVNSVDDLILQDNAVTTAKLVALAVTTAKLVDACVTTAKILDGAVTAGKIATNAVTAAKLFQGLVAGNLLVLGTDLQWHEVTASGDVTIDNTGKFTVTSTGYLALAEQQATGVGAGNSGAASSSIRGFAASGVARWVTAGSNGTLLAVAPTIDGKIKLIPGTFVCEGSSPGYGIGLHHVNLELYDSANNLKTFLRGTSEKVATSTTNRTFVTGTLTVASGDYMYLRHFTELAVTNGLGTPTSTGSPEQYALMVFRRLA